METCRAVAHAQLPVPIRLGDDCLILKSAQSKDSKESFRSSWESTHGAVTKYCDHCNRVFKDVT